MRLALLDPAGAAGGHRQPASSSIIYPISRGWKLSFLVATIQQRFEWAPRLPSGLVAPDIRSTSEHGRARSR